MTFTRNEPVATDFLSISQPKLQNNTNSSDDSFGEDHFSFSNLSGNSGKHNIIQSVQNTSHPSASIDTQTYSYMANANIPPLLYDLGGSIPMGYTPTVPTPLTNVYSPSTLFTLVGIGSVNLLDFTGAPYCSGKAIVTGINSLSQPFYMESYFFFYNSSNIKVGAIVADATTRSTIGFIGNVLIYAVNVGATTYTQLAWTITFNRIQPT